MDFKYRSKVIVIRGFYEGVTGNLEEFSTPFLETYLNYLVKVDGSAAKFIWVGENDLELIDNKKEE